MMLILKPIGRGNWAPLNMTLEGSRAQALLFQPGSIIVLAGLRYRICNVTA